MSDIDITAEIAAITAALRAHTEATITGGQLNKLIQGAAPKLDVRTAVSMPTGSGALAAFVLIHLSDHLERVGYQGKDVVYRIHGREAPKLPDGASAQIWRTFVSPSSGKHLVLEQSVPLLVARETAAENSRAEIEIRKAQLDEHDKIRQAFAASLPPAAAALLQQSGAADADFNTWIATLRRVLPNYIRDWGEFRRRQLAELFRSRITELGMSPSLESAVLNQLAAAEGAAYTKEGGGNAEAAKRPRRAPSPFGVEEALARARRLAHTAVDLMTLDELRATRLPLGVVLDADRS